MMLADQKNLGTASATRPQAPPALQFEGRQVWVTGAGRGIGHQIALAFRQLGARVVGIDRAFDREEAGPAGKRYPFKTVCMDVTDRARIAVVCQELLTEMPRIDVLVNAAGVLRLGTLDSTTVEDWQASFDINVSGVFYLLREVMPQFRKQGAGSIVNVASNAARVPRMNMLAYCASKSALVGMSHCAALELAQYGVRCNVVSPGSTDTPMLRSMLPDEQGMRRTIEGLPEQFKLGIPLRKIATAREVANTVLFLASDLASHITMQEVVVDGGATLAA
ncbi:2,3-dihydro-2,3-dihydroxybenzoate dehydrogenase [Pseudoduganella chitinolytica]|uniref:2,3-dihydro-2,3-dihydroxybenzoate dehydrogenase n=1 Tax=Pseudoduganella chitinolytica TaxID=34070 RepID=A0ABY8BGA9_9BURK|nr:2,3-dihydro-2,3-dihydroxybenzoate dehydrogenase [Pseudoduganella chitinolytica]WEF34967.1 2,3-dihydro-2,3-dihydroxybenzoate dehydrogenase [Pseudoduganella chitinolytica]